jgi:steroid delta-isomerase-like uncharacterized protein
MPDRSTPEVSGFGTKVNRSVAPWALPLALAAMATASGQPPDSAQSLTERQAHAGCLVTQKAIGNEDMRRWADAWNSHDIKKVLNLFDPAVVIHQPSNPKPLDLDGARHFFGMIFAAYPDFHITVQEAVIQDLTAASVEQVTGTWLGAFTDPATGKTTPGNGRRFDHPGIMLIKYGPDHKIRSVDIYWDRLVVDQQLGISG